MSKQGALTRLAQRRVGGALVQLWWVPSRQSYTVDTVVNNWRSRVIEVRDERAARELYENDAVLLLPENR